MDYTDSIKNIRKNIEDDLISYLGLKDKDTFVFDYYDDGNDELDEIPTGPLATPLYNLPCEENGDYADEPGYNYIVGFKIAKDKLIYITYNEDFGDSLRYGISLESLNKLNNLIEKIKNE